ncbi:sulfite oxidase [Fimbriimonas ginsengisoli]|uniref:Putative sulfite oxidase protein n=1 Tax=Fimbriimonas ginsengisoli Gsoil 348 TaxID=661478 RepID=A0A068NXK4_FIMGI|nr:sulfite oxidase [Fimbriimonas ginsengisoli]AIE87490.1 putative sulfite oxidase protein [Fimbriimonas ginsengisoli Gsoil 348]
MARAQNLGEPEPTRESPFSALDGPITPNDRYFVRSHFAAPELDLCEWRLSVEGSVEKPLSLSYDELQAMPSKSVTVTTECAGNGRRYLSPTMCGIQWEQGGVSTANWEGAPLSAILERAGVHSNAVEVVFEGADGGEIKNPPRPGAPIKFARSVPIDKCRSDVLLAYRMNGEPIAPTHGFPVRAIVPGWFGVASVKWLSRLLVVDKPYTGFFQTIEYAYWQREGGLVRRAPVAGMLVKAQIARPTAGEVIASGSSYRVVGAAWAGESSVAKVEFSDDGGENWSEARLTGNPERFAWQLWEHDWVAPATGPCFLMARATDADGNVQPVTRDLDRENYMINHVIPVTVEIV